MTANPTRPSTWARRRQVPPVGSVYNVMYENTDEKSVLLIASSVVVRQRELDDSDSSRRYQERRDGPLNILNAATPAPVVALPALNRQTFLATSGDLIPSGINAPPRDVIIQGYR